MCVDQMIESTNGTGEGKFSQLIGLLARNVLAVSVCALDACFGPTKSLSL